ncbi:MAG: hypothetical protein LWX56_14665, partial [Ignavibacteria bacterium]|nr:hypothetical protein [Ignavibacteria bacterium]
MAIKTYFSSFLHSTRLKTTLWYSLVFLLLELSIGMSIYFFLYSRLNNQLNLSLSKQASAIITYFSESKPEFDTFEPDSLYAAPEDLVWDIIYEAVALNPRNTYIQISYNDKIIYKSDNLKHIELECNTKPSKEVQIIHFVNPALSQQEIRAATVNFEKYNIIVAFPVSNIADTLNYLISLYIYLFPIFLIISVLGGAIISSKALSRIDSIIHKTDEITAQNLDQKIEGENINDEYGRLTQTMNKMINRIRNSFEYLNRFSIAASHELRTPLTILRGEIEVALKSPKTPEEYQCILESNYEETLRLIRVVDNIFYISKLDRDLLTFQMQEVSLNSFLQKVIDSVSILGKDKNITFVSEFDADINIRLDSYQMRQALYNLYDNAIKYGYPEKPIITRTE